MKSLYIMTLAFSVFVTSNIFARESAGGRGGGTGVLCEGSELVTVEEYELSLMGIENKIPESRHKILKIMRKRLKQHPHILKSWEANWNNLGPYKDWKIKSAAEYKKNLIEQAQRIIPVNTDNAEFLLEQDDLIKLSDKCKKVQISYFFNGNLFKYDALPVLSERSQRYIELHESFFMLGVSELDHMFPIKTRTLIKGLSQDLSLFDQALAQFTEKNSELKFVQSLSSVYGVRPSEETVSGKCPWLVIYVAESNVLISEIAVYIKNYSLEVSKVERKMYSDINLNSLNPILRGDNELERTRFKTGDISVIDFSSNASCTLTSLKNGAGKELPFNEKVHYAKIAQQMFLAIGAP